MFKITDTREPKRVEKNIPKLVIEFFKNKDRRLSYIASGGINFWWGFIYIFIPIFIIESGFSDLILGVFLCAVIIPLIIFSYHFGKLTCKIGFKKIAFFGYLIIAFFAFASFFAGTPVIVLILLVFASIGGAMVESPSEAYFFDIIKKDQREKFYGIYNTTIDVNNLLASFLGAIILLFLSFKFVFLFFGFVMLCISLISLRLRNVIEARRK